MAEPSNMYHHVVSTRTRFIGSSKIYFLLQRPGRGNAFHEVPIAVFKFRFHRVMENVENVSKICFPDGKKISNVDESIRVKLQRNERKKKANKFCTNKSCGIKLAAFLLSIIAS